MAAVYYHTKNGGQASWNNTTTAHFVSRPFLVLMVMIFNHPFLSLSPPPLYHPSIHPSLIAICPLFFFFLSRGVFFRYKIIHGSEKVVLLPQKKQKTYPSTQPHPVVVGCCCCCCRSVYKAGETAIIPYLQP